MANIRSQELTAVSRRIQETAEARQRHWSRITRCADHEYPYRRERIERLTGELYELFIEKRRLRAGHGA